MARNLQRDATDKAINPLLQALQLENETVRRKEVFRILNGLPKDDSVSMLFAALLKSPSSEARSHIIEELVKIGSTKAIEILAAIVADDFDPEVQRKALEGLKTIGSEEAVDAILLVLRKGPDWMQWQAARLLGDFGSDKVVQGLIEATKRTFQPNGAAIISLGRIGSDEAIERLISIMLASPFYDHGVARYYAMEWLVRSGKEKALDGLFRAWKNSGSIDEMRSSISMHLHQYPPQHLIEPLLRRLNDQALPSDERRVAAEMLGIIGTVNEIPTLKSIWQERNELTDEEVRWTALRAAEQIALSEVEKKVERERALEETRAFIAHEFRHAITPLNAYVKMLDEAVAEPDFDKEKIAALITRIRKQTDAAFDLVNTYLDYSRPLVPQFTETDINDVVVHCIEEFKFELDKRKIVLSTQFADQVRAEIDRAMLVQAIRNIISNAIEAIDTDGVLIITTATTENMVTILISDNGTGIKPEHLPHVFDVGFSTKSKVRGSGVGLALSRRIIEEAHSGSITIFNNTDSSGATVLISLPLRQMERKNGRHTSAFDDSGRR